MMAYGRIMCGILILFIFLTYLRQDIQATPPQSSSIWIVFTMGYPKFKCSVNQRIEKLTKLSGIKHWYDETFNISVAGVDKLNLACLCRRKCKTLQMDTENYETFELFLTYHCKAGICSGTGNTGRTETTTHSTIITTTFSLNSSTTRTTVSGIQTSEGPSLSSSRSIFQTTDPISTSASSPKKTQTGSVASGSQTTLVEVTSSPVPHTPINSYNTTLFTSKDPHFDLYSKAEKKNNTVVIAVCVTVFVFVLAGCILAFILYRRWRRKRAEDSVYNNGSTVTQENDVRFTNRTYSKALDEVHVNDDDTHSHSGDSGYTDMHHDDSPDDTNHDYYLIKDGIEEITEIANDDYYAIKDNVTAEYNKLAFSPKLIPEDPSYGHTRLVTNIKDKTYDHVDGKDLKVNESFDVSSLRDDDYSHLNQSKTQPNSHMRNNTIGKTIENDTVASGFNKEGDGNKSGHEYFILEQNESSTQADCHQDDDDPHKYFVLDKEIITNDKQKNGKANKKDHTTPVVNGGGLSDDLMDHSYFENCQRVDTAADTHQYQALKAHVLESKSDPVENENHDYFVLEKETKT